MFGRAPDEAAIKRHETKLEPTLDAYERILSKQKYIGGNVCAHILSRRGADIGLHRN